MFYLDPEQAIPTKSVPVFTTHTLFQPFCVLIVTLPVTHGQAVRHHFPFSDPQPTRQGIFKWACIYPFLPILLMIVYDPIHYHSLESTAVPTSLYLMPR